MTTWYYKAARSKLDHIGTLLLAKNGFLARSAHNANGSSATRVSDVQVGDLVHVYYAQKERPATPIGSYEIVDGVADANWVLGPVPGTALFKVTSAFVRKFDLKGDYEPDPVLKEFMGWLIKPAGAPPPYDPARFPGQNTLMRG
ncbi:MAG TPA: hypothetical protein VHM70_05850 [Polyangiaceae bacterium]|jgi:hypothetical protein|nr:hypothetical protein [Polyangiaceae bacterium]